VVDEELGATVEELCQRPRALVGVEPVLLLNPHPRQLAAFPRELVTAAGELLLLREQLASLGLPPLLGPDCVLRHRVLLCRPDLSRGQCSH
jgi:hypothetical protein